MDFFKAATLGAFLTGTVAMVVGSQGTDGGHLAVQLVKAGDYSMYWSWPLFFSGTGLSWGLMLLQR